MKKFFASLVLIFCLAIPARGAKPTSPSTIDEALQSVGRITGLVADDDGVMHTYGCSSFVVAPKKFLTVAHCLKENLQVDGHAAALLRVSPERDLALLEVDSERPALHLRHKSLARFEEVVGLGYGYSWTRPTVTWHRVLTLDYAPTPDIYPGVWMHGGFIHGMSGGPVIDSKGEVVSIVQRGDEQVAYGVDVNTLEDFLKGAK